jgi:hypothetical protein
MEALYNLSGSKMIGFHDLEAILPITEMKLLGLLIQP